MKPEKENVSLTPMEQSLKADRADKNFLEAAISTASHHFLTKKLRWFQLEDAQQVHLTQSTENFQFLFQGDQQSLKRSFDKHTRKIFTNDLNWRYTRFDEPFGYLEGFLEWKVSYSDANHVSVLMPNCYSLRWEIYLENE